MTPPNLLLREIPLKVTQTADGRYVLSVIVDSGGGGGGDASAANQATQITAEQAIQAGIGATTDAAITTNAVGSLSGKLRGIVAILADIWDSVNHAIGVKQIGTWTIQPGNTPNTSPWLTNHSDPAASTSTITIVDSGSSTASGQGGQSIITGTPTANSSVQATLNAHNSFAIQVLFGSATGTVSFERSIDGGTTWTPMSLPLFGVATSSVSSITSSGILHGSAGANTQIRVRATGAIAGSGGIAVRIVSSFGLSVVGAGQIGNWKTQRSLTATRTSVAGAASSGTILASNANRLGASIYNDSTAILYLDLSGGTASSSNYTVQLAAGALYEVPFNYTGLITGIWASATGNARITEYT